MENFYTDALDLRAYYTDAYGIRRTTQYECEECGTVFYGNWHSAYSMHKVYCPVCRDDTDTSMIHMRKPTLKYEDAKYILTT